MASFPGDIVHSLAVVSEEAAYSQIWLCNVHTIGLLNQRCKKTRTVIYNVSSTCYQISTIHRERTILDPVLVSRGVQNPWGICSKHRDLGKMLRELRTSLLSVRFSYLLKFVPMWTINSPYFNSMIQRCSGKIPINSSTENLQDPRYKYSIHKDLWVLWINYSVDNCLNEVYEENAAISSTYNVMMEDYTLKDHKILVKVGISRCSHHVLVAYAAVQSMSLSAVGKCQFENQNVEDN